jgi:hypothetical protein
LGFRKLSGRHEGSHSIAILCCLVTPLFFGDGCGSKIEPFEGFDIILRDAVPLSVQAAEVVLRFGMPLGGGFAEPFQGFGIVLRNVLSNGVYDAEV